jgi:hypothetical protein
MRPEKWMPVRLVFHKEDIMLIRHIGLVSESKRVSLKALTRAAAALQKQVARDFAPIWEVQATVAAFDTLDDVPTDYWPILIQDDIGVDGAAGVHEDDQGQPFALVEASDTWSLTLSHECLEMLGDPFGNRLVAGQSPKPGQGRVEFLVEVCDPSESSAFAYQVNGITVSDFYTPHFFDPVVSSSTRYSFSGAIKQPRQVLRGGYLSWHDPQTDHWFQSRFFSGTKPQFADLGQLGRQTGRKQSLRATINALTPESYEQAKVRGAQVKAVQAAKSTVDDATVARAERLHAEISSLVKRKEKK